MVDKMGPTHIDLSSQGTPRCLIYEVNPTLFCHCLLFNKRVLKVLGTRGETHTNVLTLHQKVCHDA